MRFDVLTLFPEMFEAVLGKSIIGKARQNKVVEMFFHNIRDFSKNKSKRVDDYPYGGGLGMVMQCDPIYNCIEYVKSDIKVKPHIIMMSPKGKVLTQVRAKELTCFHNVTIICGHYEGVDERVNDLFVDEELSIGDFVLTGGEIPAMALIDTIVRLLPGALKEEDSHSIESFSNGLLEYPQYTRPPEFMGAKVPDILLSGHHKNVSEWRKYQSLKQTYEKRPELLQKLNLGKDEIEMLKIIKKEQLI